MILIDYRVSMDGPGRIAVLMLPASQTLAVMTAAVRPKPAVVPSGGRTDGFPMRYAVGNYVASTIVAACMKPMSS